MYSSKITNEKLKSKLNYLGLRQKLQRPQTSIHSRHTRNSHTENQTLKSY